MCISTLGLPLFSEQIIDPPIATFSPYRIVTGYLAFTALVVISISWTLPFFGTKQRLKKIIPITVVMSVATGSLIQILQMKDYWLAGVLQRPEINQKGYGFADFPIVKEFELITIHTFSLVTLRSHTYLKIRECEAETPNLIILDPSILLSKGRYHGPNYIQQYNDLSGLMVLYLREIGVDAMYVLVSDEGESGTIFPGEGYAGRSRVFQAP